MKNPSIGIGLSGVADWSSEQPFIDVFKTARPWTGHLAGQWGGVDAADLAAGGYLDAHGWPTGFPPGVTHVSALMLTELPAAMTSVAGRYRLSYDGQGEIVVQGASNVSYGDGEIWFDFTPTGSNLLTVDILETGTNGNHIRNISVVHASNLARFEAGETFNPRFVELIEDMRSLRFMDWMRTNNSDLSRWADRSHVGDYTWGDETGVPPKVMIELANLTGTDPWFNIPHLADADYIESLARLVKERLDPQLKAHVEYSNEMWNWTFDQAEWAHQRGQARWGADVDDAWVQFYGMKAAKMAQIWRGVFGGEAEARLNLVIAPQTGWLGLETSVLNAPRWVAEERGNRAPHTYFDSYGITGYFDGGLGRDKAPIVKQWLVQSRAAAEADAEGLTGAARKAYIAEHRYDLAVRRAVAELRDGGVTGDPDGSLKQLFSTFAYHKAVADARGLELVMYEGGSHVVGVDRWADDPKLAKFFTYLNYTPQMGVLYGELLEGWRDAGGTMFNAFVGVEPPDEHGSWGALRHLDDQTSRWDALVAFNEANPGWWERRPPGTFDGSTTIFGAEGNDDLSGGDSNDEIVGLGGDDRLQGLGGNDRLSGGEDRDRLDGKGGKDRLWGQDGADALRGGDGQDQLMGGAGPDVLRGGLGADRMSGGAGGDSLLYRGSAESRPGAFDTVTGFDTSQDRFDLSALDLVRFSTRATFSGQAGEIIAQRSAPVAGAGWEGWLRADADGDEVADLLIRLENVVGTLSADDFLL